MTARQRERAASFVWRCDVCGEAIADDDGYLCADWSAASRCEDEQRRARAATARRAEERGDGLIPASTITSLSRVPWCVYHRACDPEPERGDYWFGVERCRTLAALLDWNVHLCAKPWVVGHTDWPRFIHRHLAEGKAAM